MKLLLADRSEAFCDALREQLEAVCSVRVCHDGITAAQLLFEECPDLLLLDMDLPGLDGITILQTLRDTGRDLPVIMLVSKLTDFEYNWLQSLKVDSILQKPCTICQTLLRISEVLHFYEGRESSESKEAVVERILLCLGFCMNLTGYACVSHGICILAENMTQPVTKVLYPAVAALCGCSPQSVERSIRTAIKNAWIHRNDAIWRMYFAPGRDGRISCPSNGVFLTRIAACVAKESRKVV